MPYDADRNYWLHILAGDWFVRATVDNRLVATFPPIRVADPCWSLMEAVCHAKSDEEVNRLISTYKEG